MGGALRVVRATGDAATRGQQIGRELRDLINESVDFYHPLPGAPGRVVAAAAGPAHPVPRGVRVTFPSLMTMLKAMAIGATVPVLELFAVNAFEELEPRLEAPRRRPASSSARSGYLEPPERRAAAPRGPMLELHGRPARTPRSWRTTNTGSPPTVARGLVIEDNRTTARL